MITLSDIVDLGGGQYRCKVTITEDMNTVSGFVAAGEYDHFTVIPGDRFGLGPIVLDMIQNGETER